MIAYPHSRLIGLLAMAIIWTAVIRLNGADTERNADRWSNARDPFWPVGYSPPPPPDLEHPDTGTPSIQEQIRWPELRLTALTRTGDGHFLALIEGVGITEVGEIIQVEREGLVYRWRVDEITSRGISLSRIDVRSVRGNLQ